jgi:hypothetical protein
VTSSRKDLDVSKGWREDHARLERATDAILRRCSPRGGEHATTYPARSFPPRSPATAKTGSAICPVTAALERSYCWAGGVDVAALSRLAGTVSVFAVASVLLDSRWAAEELAQDGVVVAHRQLGHRRLRGSWADNAFCRPVIFDGRGVSTQATTWP